MKTKIRIQLGSMVLLTILVISLMLSPYSSPDFPPFFALKRMQEKAFFKLQSSPESKIRYMSSLLDYRLQELQNLVKNRSYDYVLPAALRYSTLVGQITELIVANNMTEEANVMKDKFSNHRKLTDEVYVAYPKNIPDNWEWKYIQDDYNYLGIYLDQLSKVK